MAAYEAVVMKDLHSWDDCPRESWEKMFSRTQEQMGEEWNATWAAADTNGDSLLNEAEFCDYMDKSCANDEANTGFRPAQDEALWKEMYAAISGREGVEDGISMAAFQKYFGCCM